MNAKLHVEKRYLSQFLCAPQYKRKRFVTMTTYLVPDLSNIKGFSGHLWHSILIFANKAPNGGRCSGLMVTALNSGVSGPGLSLSRDIVLCSWARLFTPTVPLSTQVYKWVWANCWGNLTNFIIKFPYNTRSDWLKQHTLSEIKI